MTCITHPLVKTGVHLSLAPEKANPFINHQDTTCGPWIHFLLPNNPLLSCSAGYVFCKTCTLAKLTIATTCTEELWLCPLWPLKSRGSFQMGGYNSPSRWAFGGAALTVWQAVLTLTGCSIDSGVGLTEWAVCLSFEFRWEGKPAAHMQALYRAVIL